jgi:amino acid adenylation domain-containing protein
MDNLATLHSLFEVQAEKYPHHLAVIFNNDALTYEQLNQRANQFAHYLIKQGVTPDTLIAVFLERSVDFLITVLAILKAGGAYIPLDTTYPDERVSLILKDAGNPFLITSRGHEKKFVSNVGPLILFDNEYIENQPIHNPAALILAEHLAYVIYTSGSTGTPKGVLIEHGSVVNYALWFSQYYDNVSKIDFSSNHAFDLAITLYLVPLVSGLTVVICPDIIKKDPKHYLNYLNKNAIDFIKLTPSYFKVLLNEIHHTPIKLPHLKKIMLGGENLTKAACDSWLSLYPHHIIYNEYGPTETTVGVTVFAVDKQNIRELGENIPIGALVTNTYAYILDNDLKPVTNGEVGELYIGGACLARGYLNSPELTLKYFIKDPFVQGDHARIYKTGDLCRRTPGDIFECMGRIDHQIKIRGFRIEPEEIENYLSTHPALKAVVVIAAAHDHKEKRLIAYYILKNAKTELDARELSHYLKYYLPEYMIPAAFIRMDSFPLNGNDKLDRAALPIPQFQSSQSYVPARNRLEKTLVRIWSEELGVNPIGVNDDFFELGGHSLSAALIISKINHKLKKEISLHDLYTNATISNLTPIIKRAKIIEKKQMSLTKKLNNDAALFPLSDFQFMLWIANTFEPKAKKLNIFTRKRIHGRLDLKRLNRAFALLIQKHEVLSYQVSKFRPGQYLVKNTPVVIVETSLTSLSDGEREAVLEDSVKNLINYSDWTKEAPKIMIRLFLLKDEISELQFSIPHIISDDLSSEILLFDLSKFYSSGRQNKNQVPDRSYRNYLFDEQFYLKQYLNRDIDFWDNYLKDARLYSFPSEYVIKDMQAQNYAYSTYIEIPENNLIDLNSFCATNHISILDGLCAVVTLALKNRIPVSKNLLMCLNRVKSTRASQDFENTVGCFLRIEPIKVIISETTNLQILSQEIHQAVINTNLYQGCPNLVKLASIGTFRIETNIIRKILAKSFFWLYSLIFQTQIYYKTLSLIERLKSLKENSFLININMQTNFLISPQKENERLFGFKEQKIPTHQYDLLKINNVFDVSFLRMSDSKKLFLIISANLKPDYREAIGNEMIRIMNDELSEATSRVRE